MSQTTVDQPGVCTIGPTEIRRRQLSGWLGSTLVFEGTGSMPAAGLGMSA